MSIAFVKKSISNLSLPTDTWTCLEGKVARIYLLSETYLSIDKHTRWFYFDSANNTLYIKYISGKLYTYDASVVGSNGYIALTLEDGTVVLGKEEDGGIEYGSLGKVHSIISYDAIIAFINENQNINYYIENL